jgi:hypothetical protein
MSADDSRRDADAERVRTLIGAYRNGEDPDLSELSRALWEILYGLIPRLTGSTSKHEQHRILESYLADIGLPPSADLQYIAGPVLWYAREKRVLPPARNDDQGSSWSLNEQVFAEGRRTLDEGRVSFGDWMTNALRALLAEQQ